MKPKTQVNKNNKTVPKKLQYLYYAICELVDIRTANDLLESGKLEEWINRL